MEVHAHTHTERKRFKHYLFEFFMLFLAVFCGFLAENFREHQVEKQRSKQYIRSFYEDLKTDTTRLNRGIRTETRRATTLLVFKSCYDSLLQNQNPHSLLEIIKNTSFNNGFGPEQRTINQLTNAGGFRLLKKEDADSIASYIQRCNVIENFEKTAYQQTQDNIRTIFNQFIDFSANASLNPNLLESPGLFIESTTVPLMTESNKKIMNEYFNTVLQYIRVVVNHRNLMARVKEKADGMIEYFKKKYGFD